MKHIIPGAAVIVLALGLWNHDWTLIGSSLLVIIVWSLIADDVLLPPRDHHWDDDDRTNGAH